VTTALHYPYDPVVNAATVAKLASPLSGVSVSNLAFDGSGTVSTGLYLVGVVNSTVSNATAQNFVDWGLVSFYAYNLAWNNVAVTHAGNGNSNAFLLWGQGRPSINGATLSNLNSTAFGLGLSTVTDGTFTNVTIDKAGTTSGRPFKTIAASYNIFTGLTVRNGIGSRGYNGMSLEYYSSHNSFTGCLVTNNSNSGGIIGFGNYNQYNKFVNCTVSGNSGWQLGQGASALGQYNDTHWEISGGIYTGTSGNSVIQLNSPNSYVHDASVNSPGDNGIFVGSNSGCINNNRFTGTFAYYSIYFGGTGDHANANTTVGSTYPDPLPSGTCP
jgi:hypothetical protein